MSKTLGDVNIALDQVRTLLEVDNPREAMEALSPFLRSGSRAVINAYGVCLMRLGRFDDAVKVFRGVVYEGDALAARASASTEMRCNLATALLLSHRVDGCLAILNEMRDEQTPVAARLKAAIVRWKRSLSFLQRVQFAFGGVPGKAVSLDFPPGEP